MAGKETREKMRASPDLKRDDFPSMKLLLNMHHLITAAAV